MLPNFNPLERKKDLFGYFAVLLEAITYVLILHLTIFNKLLSSYKRYLKTHILKIMQFSKTY